MEDNDMELDFNPFDSTFENFEDFNSHDVESLAKELHFYEEKAEFLAGQGALEVFSLSRDAFSMQHDYFADMVQLDSNIQTQKVASPPRSDMHFAGQGFRGFAEGKKQPQPGASPSKSAEEQAPPRTNSSGSLKRSLSEQAGYSGGSHSEEAHSRTFRGLAYGHEAPAVDSDAFGQSSDAFARGYGQSSDGYGQSSDAYGQGPGARGPSPNGLRRNPEHHEELHSPGAQVHSLAPLDDSLLGSQIEPRSGEAPVAFSNEDGQIFRFDSDSKPFDFGAALFGHVPNGTPALPGLDSDSPHGQREGGSSSPLEPGLLTTEDAHEITKANMWVSSDGDDRPIGSLKEAKTPKKAGSGKRTSRKRSAPAVTKKMDPLEAARLEKNRIKAQRHRDKMKAWKEDVKLENEDLRAQRAKLAEEREALAVGKASLEREKNEMEKTLSRLQGEMSRLQSENARLWKENQELSKAAHAGQRQADVELLREPSGTEGPQVAELQKLNDRLKEQNGKLEEELAVVKGAFAAQLHTMSNLVAIRPPGRDDEG